MSPQSVHARLRPFAKRWFKPSPPTGRSGPIPAPLATLYADFNGGYFWGGALLIRPLDGNEATPKAIGEWNEPGLWKGHYGHACDGITFFAEDAFGMPFGLKDQQVVQFDPETAAVTESGSIDDWAASVVADPSFLTGAPVLAAWETEHGPLPVGYRLMPKQLFMLGGEFDSRNMVSKPDDESLRVRADLGRAMKDLPDGQRLVFSVRKDS